MTLQQRVRQLRDRWSIVCVAEKNFYHGCKGQSHVQTILENRRIAILGYIEDSKRHLPALLEKLEAAQERERWRDVREELPEEDSRVLVWVEGVGARHSRFSAEYFPEEYLRGFAFAAVTHWRPLPDGPKEKQS